MHLTIKIINTLVGLKACWGMVAKYFSKVLLKSYVFKCYGPLKLELVLCDFYNWINRNWERNREGGWKKDKSWIAYK